MLKEYQTIHQNALVVDGHCDTLLEILLKNRSFFDSPGKGHLDYERLKLGSVNLQFLAIYIEPEFKPVGALARALEILDCFYRIQGNDSQLLPVILTKADLDALSANKTAFLLAIEGGEALEGKLSTLRILHRLGIRSLTLTWNQRNQLADGIWEKEGLTHFGREVIQEMNRLGMLIDVSHLSEKGFEDVIVLSKKPIAATHSCCRALCNHPRNLSDSQLKALKENKGIIGINFYPGFLGEESKITLEHVIEHIEHAVSIMGIEHVGLGSDFDGIDQTPEGLEDVTCLPKITERLHKNGWKEEAIKKVLGGNFIRVLKQVLY